MFAIWQNSFAEYLSKKTWQNRNGKLEKILAGKDRILAGQNVWPPSENDPATPMATAPGEGPNSGLLHVETVY